MLEPALQIPSDDGYPTATSFEQVVFIPWPTPTDNLKFVIAGKN